MTYIGEDGAELSAMEPRALGSLRRFIGCLIGQYGAFPVTTPVSRRHSDRRPPQRLTSVARRLQRPDSKRRSTLIDG
jgi:hypothetical protein